MKPPKATILLFLRAAICVGCALLPAAPGAASELAATHLVFEKAVKMKKADAYVFLPLLDQSRKSDSPENERLVDCRAFTEGKAGPLAVNGAFRLQILGTAGGDPWKSVRISVPTDADGRARFQPADIRKLVDEAIEAGAGGYLLRLDFDGGKGKKVTRLTVDCENREAES